MSSNGNTFALVILHWMNLMPPSKLVWIKILRDNARNESNVVCNKKKIKFTVKFSVVPPQDGAKMTMMPLLSKA